MTVTPAEIVRFWAEAGPRAWFAHSDAFDEAVRRRLGPLQGPAAAGELDDWQRTAEGALALVLLLDQVPRNLCRGSARAFAADAGARAVAGRAIGAGFDRQTPGALRQFFYLPFAHSEDLADQDRSLALAEALEAEEGVSAASARIHRDIIARFDRFPHRNQALGRRTTAEEQTFLDEGGFAG